MKPIRNRILRHVRIRAGDLVPHELNPRVHTDAQRRVLEQLYDEIGFARSLLAYPLADGRLKLIDGHLRASITPDQEIDVEVLDVNDSEARTLLMAIDPIAQLAGNDGEKFDALRETVEASSAAIKTLVQVVRESDHRTSRKLKRFDNKENATEQFYILVECTDEAQQCELLARFTSEGLKCEAKLA
jgi:hypothetical protein